MTGNIIFRLNTTLRLRSVGKKRVIFGVQPRNFKGLSRLSVKSGTFIRGISLFFTTEIDSMPVLVGVHSGGDKAPISFFVVFSSISGFLRF